LDSRCFFKVLLRKNIKSIYLRERQNPYYVKTPAFPTTEKNMTEFCQHTGVEGSKREIKHS
jgi:hypothetical protein